MSDRPERAVPALTALLQTLMRQSGDLLGAEFSLATSELRAKARGLIVAAICVAAASSAAFFGACALVFCAIALLQLVIPLWAAALVTALTLTIVAALLALVAKSLIARLQPLLPKRTIASLKEDLAWLRTTPHASKPE